MMLAEERKMEILSRIDTEGIVRVNDLAIRYKVTEATIRRDFKSLEEKGYIKRTHGGALLNDESIQELNFFQKKSKNFQAKEAIGLYAASLINDGETIIIDASTTTLQIAKHIKNKKINVITNSIDVIEELLDSPDIQIISTGGIVRSNTRAMVGPFADATVKNFIVDKAFMGANAIDIDYGFSSAHIIEVELKKAMINIAKEVIFLCESLKFEQIKLAKICDLDKVYCVITDKNISKDVLQKYKEILKVIVVE